MVTKAKETPSELFLQYAELMLHAAENGERNVANQNKRIEKTEEAINLILQRLAAIDTTEKTNSKQDIRIGKLETFVTDIDKSVAKLDTKIVTAALIIAAIIAIFEISFNVFIK